MKLFPRCFCVLCAVALLTAAASAEMKEVSPFTAVIGSDGIQRVEIVGGSYFFKPNKITLKVNVSAELSVTKEAGLTPHNIVVKAPEAGIDFNLELGKEAKSVKFTPTKAGSYPMICSKKFLWMSHQEKGMEGVIEVVE